MQAVSLLTLRTSVRQRCNMENSQFVSDSELNRYINQSLAELYDLVVASYEDYEIQEIVFNYTSSSNQPSDDGYTLPADFYKIRGLDFQAGTEWAEVEPFTFINRNRSSSTDIYTNRAFLYPARNYKVVGNSLRLIPIGQCNGTYRMFYIPCPTALVNDGDTTSLSFSGWDEYVVVDASIKCMQKEESDVSVLQMQKQELKQRILEMAGSRDAGAPKQVEIRRSRNRGWFY